MAKFKKGNKQGHGRPNGSKNKFTTLKEAFINAFNESGGQAKLTKWAKLKPKEFYTLIARMLPTNLKEEENKNLTIVLTKYGAGLEKENILNLKAEGLSKNKICRALNLSEERFEAILNEPDKTE